MGGLNRNFSENLTHSLVPGGSFMNSNSSKFEQFHHGQG